MAKIKTFELDRWSEPDEKRRVRHIGMADAKETFDRLQTHLELKGLLPDEYFLFSDELTGELPEFDQALCIPNFGASEGIYLDISLACRDKDGKRYFQNFATGKTLGETADDYYRMFRIAAECSLMLNGRGNTYEQKKVDIVLTEQEAEAVGTVVDMELCGHHPPEAEAILNSALEKIDRIAFAKVQTITCHGKDDYSLWSAEIPKDMLHSILHEACERVGTLDELMDAMNPKDGYEMRLFIQTPGRQFAFYRIPERLSNLEDYAKAEQRGAMEQDDREGVVLEYLDMMLPDGWDEMGTHQRRDYILDQEDPTRAKGTHRRNEVSNMEIWCECFGKRREELSGRDSYAISAIMAHLEGWSKPEIRKRIPIYGLQRLYRRLS